MTALTNRDHFIQITPEKTIMVRHKGPISISTPVFVEDQLCSGIVRQVVTEGGPKCYVIETPTKWMAAHQEYVYPIH